MLTYFQSQDVLEALLLAKKFSNEVSTEDQEKLIDKAIKYISNAIREGKMPLGEHEDDIRYESEPDQIVYAMRNYWRY